MIDVFDGFFKGKKVLVTGHTGFKGSWLCIWLHELGAEVIGVGLDPYSERDNFVLSGIGSKIKADIRADIRDGEKMKQIFAEYQPEIVFHLAAQPLVRLSYEIPVETYEVNVMGTIHIMEAIRATKSVKVGVMITTDKCYDNNEQLEGYVETDPFGGYWWLPLPILQNTVLTVVNQLLANFCFVTQNQRGTKTGQNHGKIKSRTLRPKYPLWNTSVSFAKVQICPLKNEGKSLFLSFTTHFPTIVP